jgi:hypothetical protein
VEARKLNHFAAVHLRAIRAYGVLSSRRVGQERTAEVCRPPPSPQPRSRELEIERREKEKERKKERERERKKERREREPP